MDVQEERSTFEKRDSLVEQRHHGVSYIDERQHVV